MQCSTGGGKGLARFSRVILVRPARASTSVAGEKRRLPRSAPGMTVFHSMSLM